MKKQPITLTHAELVNCVNTLNMLLTSRPTLGIMQGFPIEQNIRVMQPEANEVWETRNKIIAKYTQKNEDGEPLTEGQNYVFVGPEDEESAKNEMLSLNAIETTLNLYRMTLEALVVFGDQPHYVWGSLTPLLELDD